MNNASTGGIAPILFVLSRDCKVPGLWALQHNLRAEPRHVFCFQAESLPEAWRLLGADQYWIPSKHRCPSSESVEGTCMRHRWPEQMMTRHSENQFSELLSGCLSQTQHCAWLIANVLVWRRAPNILQTDSLRGQHSHEDLLKLCTYSYHLKSHHRIHF